MAGVTKPPGISHAVFDVPSLPTPTPTPPGVPIPFPNNNAHFEAGNPAVPVINTLFHHDPIVTIEAGPPHHDDFLLLV
jgi:hypothetical protein